MHVSKKQSTIYSHGQKKYIAKELGHSSADCSNFANTDISKNRKNIYATRKTLLTNIGIL